MNTNALNLQLQRDVARLIDGELPDDQLASLLLTLEETPDAWRYCALGFIEAQVLAGALATVGDSVRDDTRDGVRDGAHRSAPSATAPTTRPAADNGSKHRSDTPARGLRRRDVPFAACLAVCVILLLWPFPWPTTQPSRQPQNAGSLPPQAPAHQSTHHPRSPNIKTAPRPSDARSHLVQAAYEDLGPALGNVTLRSGEDNSAAVTLPVFAESEAHAERFLQPAISQELQQALRDAGHRINHRVSYEPVWVGEDQVLFVPLEEVELSPNPYHGIIP